MNNQTDSPKNEGLLLTADEAALINDLRSDNKEHVREAILALVGDILMPLLSAEGSKDKTAPLPPVEKEKDTTPRGQAGYAPMEITRQFATFLFGRMALGGSLTKNQMEDGEEIEWIIDDLTNGVDEAVRGWTLGNFTDLQDFYNCAEWGRDAFRARRSMKDGAE